MRYSTKSKYRVKLFKYHVALLKCDHFEMGPYIILISNSYARLLPKSDKLNGKKSCEIAHIENIILQANAIRADIIFK